MALDGRVLRADDRDHRPRGARLLGVSLTAHGVCGQMMAPHGAVIIVRSGNGPSLSAVHGGRSIETTMRLPLSMAYRCSRCSALDRRDDRSLLCVGCHINGEAIEGMPHKHRDLFGVVPGSLGGMARSALSVWVRERAVEACRRLRDRTDWYEIGTDAIACELGGRGVGRTENAVSIWVIPTEGNAVTTGHAWPIHRGRR